MTTPPAKSGKLLRFRVWIRESLTLGDMQSMLLWAALIGFIGSLATVAFREGIHGLLFLLMGRSESSLVETAMQLPWWQRLLVPTFGGLVAGQILQTGLHFARGQSSTDYMEAIALGDGVIGVRQTLVKSVSSLFSIASGGSLGREGSMVQLSAMLASFAGRIARFSPPRLRLLVACGAAAGITSAYNAPIAGALFVAEIVLGSIAMESFGPLIVASVVANIMIHQFFGYKPTYQMPAFDFVSGWEVIFYVGLGLVAGALAPQYLRLLEAAKRVFAGLRWPLSLKLAAGGFAVGLISIQTPQVWGNGYSVVNSILNTPWGWQLLAMVLVSKLLATAFTTGSGAVGGIFTPTLFVGAAIGALFGQGLDAVWPAAAAIPGAYAAVGMGSFLAATTHAPLTAILMIFEMTLSYQIVLPLMLACVTAYYTARLYRSESMYTASLRRKNAGSAGPGFEAMCVADVLKPDPPRVAPSAPFAEVAQAFATHRVQNLYVTDAGGRFLGVISLHDLRPFLADAALAARTTAADVLASGIPTLAPGMSLGDALQQFVAHHGERLPVVDPQGGNRLVGSVSKTDLLLLLHESLRHS